MRGDLEEVVTEAAAVARNLLGQLGPLAWALHTRGGAVVPTALCLDFEPGEYVAIRTDEALKKKQERKSKVVGLLRSLKQGRGGRHPELFTSAGYREAINRSIIVYAAAVLEHFLDVAGEPLWIHSDDERWPADALTMVCRLAGRPTRIDLRGLSHYLSTGWLVLVRNAIIHSSGKAERAGCDARQYKLLNTSGCAPWRRDEHCDENGMCHHILVWDESSHEVASDDWQHRAFSVPIDSFILPRLQEAQAFVVHAGEALVQAARARRQAADPRETH
jgi:hypothetical protein